VDGSVLEFGSNAGLTSALQDLLQLGNQALRLVDARTEKILVDDLERIGGERLLQILGAAGVASPDEMVTITRETPNLRSLCRTEKGRALINDWKEKHQAQINQARHIATTIAGCLPAFQEAELSTKEPTFTVPTRIKNKRVKPGPLSETDVECELWYALKYLDDLYELDKSRLLHLKPVQVLAQRWDWDGASIKGEVLRNILLSCIERLKEKAEGGGRQFSRCAQLLAEIAQGSTVAEASRKMGLSREHVTRKYCPKAMKILAREFVAEAEKRVRASSHPNKT